MAINVGIGRAITRGHRFIHGEGQKWKKEKLNTRSDCLPRGATPVEYPHKTLGFSIVANSRDYLGGANPIIGECSPS